MYSVCISKLGTILCYPCTHTHTHTHTILHSNGYKMCIRAYLNGDGSGYKTHFSVFFVLMRGEFDPLLKWPFEYKVHQLADINLSHVLHLSIVLLPLYIASFPPSLSLRPTLLLTMLYDTQWNHSRFEIV